MYLIIYAIVVDVCIYILGVRDYGKGLANIDRKEFFCEILYKMSQRGEGAEGPSPPPSCRQYAYVYIIYFHVPTFTLPPPHPIIQLILYNIIQGLGCVLI